jgi:dUTP pyrophosphatase
MNLHVYKITGRKNYDENLKRGSSEAAGFDLCFNPEDDQPILLEPMKSYLLETGIQISFDQGYEAQVRPRSGFSLKNLCIVGNSPGTIDSDYTGEIKVIMIPLAKEVRIFPGDRIAQLVFNKVEYPESITLVSSSEDLKKTERGSGGFGSTGK